jgi:hypothetical protein
MSKESKLDQIRALRGRRQSKNPCSVTTTMGGVGVSPMVVREMGSQPGVSLDMVQEEPYEGASEAPSPKVKPKWPSRLKAISVSVAEFGRLTGTPLRTIKGWATGENETHGWVEPMISLMERDPANIAALKGARKKKNEQS